MRVLLILLLLTGVALADPQADFVQALGEAKVLLEAGSYRAALEDLDRADQLFPQVTGVTEVEWKDVLRLTRLLARREMGEAVLDQALQERFSDPEHQLQQELMIVLEARRTGRLDVLAAHLGPARELARNAQGAMGPTGRFILETVEFERDWQTARRLTVKDFIARHNHAWDELRKLTPPVTEEFLGYWLMEAAIIWAEGRAALEAEYGPLPELAALGQADSAILMPLAPGWNSMAVATADMVLQMNDAYRGTTTGATLDKQLLSYEPAIQGLERTAAELEKTYPGKLRGRLPLVIGHYYQARARQDATRAKAWLAQARPYIEQSESRAALDSLMVDEMELQPVQTTSHWEPADPALRARVLVLRGNPSQALDLSEDLVRLGAGTMALRREALAVARRAANALAEKQLASGDADGALQTRARLALLESWVRLDLDRVRSTSPAEQKSLEKLADARVTGDRQSYYQALNELQKAQPGLTRLIVRPSSFATYQAKIPADMAVVQYFSAPEKLYIFVATSDKLQVREAPVGQEELIKQVHAMRRSLVDPKAAPDLKPLRDVLIAPIEADLTGRKLLAFIPTGVLVYVPFSVLDERPSTVLMKATDFNALLIPAEPHSLTLVALGDPDGSLPGARQEVQALARLLPDSHTYIGKEAGVDRIAAGPSLLHLATHGVLNPNDPLSSYLIVAPDAHCPDGRLRVADVAGLQLAGVSLVTLSACQTALAERDPQPGQELATLADAFNYAGSPSLVASLWKVPDKSTALLMEELYRALAAGKSRAVALEQARDAVRTIPEYRHPFYWAGFILLGDWR